MPVYIYSSNNLYTHEIHQLPAADDMTVDHIKYLQLLSVEFVCSRRTTILDKDYVETFIRQAAHRRWDTLIGKYTGEHHIFYAHVVK